MYKKNSLLLVSLLASLLLSACGDKAQTSGEVAQQSQVDIAPMYEQHVETFRATATGRGWPTDVAITETTWNLKETLIKS